MIVKNNHLLVLGMFASAALIALGVAGITGSSGEVQAFIRRTSVPAQVRVQQFREYFYTPLTALLHNWHNSVTIEDLATENTVLRAQLVRLEQLEKENTELRAQLGVQPAVFEKQLLSTPILSFPYRLISIGAQSGVQVGSLVLVKGTLVGRVIEVAADYSRVVLLSDQADEAVIGITNLGQRGIVRGIDRQLVITEVPQDASITTGDRVMTAGEKGVKPGIFIGTIGEEKTKVTDAVKTFSIEQVVSFDTASLVEIQ